MLARRTLLAAAAAVLMAGAANTAAFAQQKVVIGHFGTPIPLQAAIAAKDFNKATGWEIEWRKFGSGAEIIAAMASGDLKIAELGSAPLAIGASQGVDYQMFAISNIIGDAESLIVRNGAGITKVEELKGKKVGVPLGSTAHYSLMGAIKNAGLTPRDVEVIGMKPDQINAAWDQGQIDATFIWEPAKSKALKTGKMILAANQVKGAPTFDGWVVNTKFGKDNPEFMAKFLKALDAANAAYTSNPGAWTATSPAVVAIAAQTGSPAAEVPEALKGYAFPSLKTMASADWLGGGSQANMLATAKFLLENKRVDAISTDYSKFVNADYLAAAMK
jgi:taurine transport system substrate-binding protein